MNEPPKINEVVFDYDHPEHPTHFLDHHWWQKSRCEKFQKWPRGLKVHWRYWNEHKKESDLEWWYRVTHCWWGRHRWEQWYRTNSDGRELPMISMPLTCRWCRKPKEE